MVMRKKKCNHYRWLFIGIRSLYTDGLPLIGGGGPVSSELNEHFTFKRLI